MDFPISYFEKNIIVLNDKSWWAAYEIHGFQYSNKSNMAKMEDFKRLVDFYQALKNDVHMLLVPHLYSFSTHFQKLKDRAKGPFRVFAHSHADMTKDYLESVYGNDGSNHRYYLIVKLEKPSDMKEVVGNLKDELLSFLKGARDQVEEVAGIHGIELSERDFTKVMQSEKHYFNKNQSGSIASGPSLSRLTEEQIDWLIRRNFWKGIGQPPKTYLFQANKQVEQTKSKDTNERKVVKTNRKAADKTERNNKKFIRPRRAEFLNLTEGEINLTNRRNIKITQNTLDGPKSSYCTYLTISEPPYEVSVPGQEWLSSIQYIHFPVAVSVHIKPHDPDASKRKIINKRMQIDEQEEHTAESSKVPLAIQHSVQEATELEKVITDAQYPLLDCKITFEIFGESEEQVIDQRESLIGAYKQNFDMKLVCPSGQQWQMFNEFIPGAAGKIENDYAQRFSPEVMAASMFGATNQIGDNEGFFIGFTTGGFPRPVFLDPANAPKRNLSGSIALTGTLGGGKSFTANLLTYLTTLYGAKSLILDPKGDRDKWVKYLTEFTQPDELEFVTLDDREEDAGKLDPYGFLSPGEASAVAMDIITFLFNIQTDHEHYFDLNDAIEKVKVTNNPTMSKIIQVLQSEESETAAKLAKKLEAYKTSPYGRLLFADQHKNTLKLEKRVTIIQINNLNLPEPEELREDYSISQILSVALMIPLARFALKLAEDKTQFTSITMDESWALLGSKQGRALANKLVRTGRSWYSAVFLISQNVRDLEAIKSNIGAKFIFKMTDDKEMEDTLKFLNLSDTSENRELIRNIQNGQPVLQDYHGRVAQVDIEAIFNHLIKAFNTTPTDEMETTQEQVAQ